jgi:hypothetical protein
MAFSILSKDAFWQHKRKELSSELIEPMIYAIRRIWCPISSDFLQTKMGTIVSIGRFAFNPLALRHCQGMRERKQTSYESKLCAPVVKSL